MLIKTKDKQRFLNDQSRYKSLNIKFLPKCKEEQKYVFTMNVMDISDICMLVQLFMGRKNKQKPQIHDT